MGGRDINKLNRQIIRMVRRSIGQTSVRHSPRSEQAKKCFSKGATVLYVGSIDIGNPLSDDDLNSCITKVLEGPKEFRESKIFINSQDYLRVVNAQSGKLLFCIPVDVIVNCIQSHQHFIAFSASTSIHPNPNTISMAHVFKCSSLRQSEEFYDALLITMKSACKREDRTKIVPLFTKLKADSSLAHKDKNVFMYHSKFPGNLNIQISQNENLIFTNHSLFKNAFDCLKNDNQERMFAIVTTELNILFSDDAGQTLLHLAVRMDKYSSCKYLLNQCCRSDSERDSLRTAKVSDFMDMQPKVEDVLFPKKG